MNKQTQIRSCVGTHSVRPWPQGDLLRKDKMAAEWRTHTVRPCKRVIHAH